jgi:hypothetical protein
MKPSAFFGAAAVAAVCAAALLGSAPAAAQTRVFVSGSGSDANPCSLGAPCRSFQQAHNTVAAGGEIVALDAAGYGPLVINKSVTVTAIGIEASITSNSTNHFGIVINGTGAVVAIRGLTLISGFTGPSDGIDIDAAASVTIRDCSISGFPNAGIALPLANNLDVELRDVTANNNGTYGIDIVPGASGKMTLLIADSSFSGNGSHGIFIDGSFSTGTLNATLNASVAGNGGDGLLAQSFTGAAQAVVMVTASKLVNNLSSGLSASGSKVTVLVDRTQISGNVGNGWEAVSSATVNSYKNNEVNGNGNDALNGVTQINSE